MTVEAPGWAASSAISGGVGGLARSPRRGFLVGRVAAAWLLGALGWAFLARVDRLGGGRGRLAAAFLDRTLVALDGHRPEARRLHLLRERVGVADEDDRHPRGVDPARSRVTDRGDIDGFDGRPVVDQLVVGQLVDEQPR